MALVNGTLIDGNGREPLHDAVLLIQDGQIISVGQREQVQIPSQAKVVDVNGRTILPGFINSHVHSVNLENLQE